MHPADPACGKDPDANPRRREQGGRHRGAAAQTPGHGNPKIPQADLARTVQVRQPVQFGIAQADVDLAVQQGSGGRRRAFGPDGGFHFTGQVQVFGPRQAEGDHGRLQRHQGRADPGRLSQGALDHKMLR